MGVDLVLQSQILRLLLLELLLFLAVELLIDIIQKNIQGRCVLPVFRKKTPHISFPAVAPQRPIEFPL